MKSRAEKEETSEIQLCVRSAEGQELKPLGKLKEEKLKSLADHLEEVEDNEYYINRDTLDFLKEQKVDYELIQLLEKALKGLEPDDGVDIVCSKGTENSTILDKPNPKDLWMPLNSSTVKEFTSAIVRFSKEDSGGTAMLLFFLGLFSPFTWTDFGSYSSCLRRHWRFCWCGIWYLFCKIFVGCKRQG
jgi:hypothetical protein